MWNFSKNKKKWNKFLLFKQIWLNFGFIQRNEFIFLIFFLVLVLYKYSCKHECQNFTLSITIWLPVKCQYYSKKKKRTNTEWMNWTKEY